MCQIIQKNMFVEYMVLAISLLAVPKMILSEDVCEKHLLSMTTVDQGIFSVNDDRAVKDGDKIMTSDNVLKLKAIMTGGAFVMISSKVRTKKVIKINWSCLDSGNTVLYSKTINVPNVLNWVTTEIEEEFVGCSSVVVKFTKQSPNGKKMGVKNWSMKSFVIPNLPFDCTSVGSSGVYTILGGTACKEVYCDMDTDGGGWTVIHKRFDGSVDFENKDWEAYVNGFGSASGEYWFGLGDISSMTQQYTYEVRFDLVSMSGAVGFGVYDTFALGTSSEEYKLLIGQYVAGNIDDALSSTAAYPEHGRAFSTYDHDTEGSTCAVSVEGAWWYIVDIGCGQASLHRLFGTSGWLAWSEDPDATIGPSEIKIRRVLS